VHELSIGLKNLFQEEPNPKLEPIMPDDDWNEWFFTEREQGLESLILNDNNTADVVGS
jgi:uncharacterized membrane protein